MDTIEDTQDVDAPGSSPGTTDVQVDSSPASDTESHKPADTVSDSAESKKESADEIKARLVADLSKNAEEPTEEAEDTGSEATDEPTQADTAKAPVEKPASEEDEIEKEFPIPDSKKPGAGENFKKLRERLKEVTPAAKFGKDILDQIVGKVPPDQFVEIVGRTSEFDPAECIAWLDIGKKARSNSPEAAQLLYKMAVAAGYQPPKPPEKPDWKSQPDLVKQVKALKLDEETAQEMAEDRAKVVEAEKPKQQDPPPRQPAPSTQQPRSAQHPAAAVEVAKSIDSLDVQYEKTYGPAWKQVRPAVEAKLAAFAKTNPHTAWKQQFLDVATAELARAGVKPQAASTKPIGKTGLRPTTSTPSSTSKVDPKTSATRIAMGLE